MNRTVLIFLILLTGSRIFADYPLIRYTMSSRDPLYSQQQQDVEIWYAGREQPSLAIYRYVPRPSEDLFSVAAAFNLPYDTVATLNGWDAPGLLNPGEEILIPNIPGIFIPHESQEDENNAHDAENTAETGDSGSGNGQTHLHIRLQSRSGAVLNYRFYPGSRFSAEERTRFFGSIFRSPLGGYAVTSPFGYRQNPFGPGRVFHPGVDLAAQTGTAVRAARDGTVSETGILEIYGIYVILDHNGGYQSVYAHLNESLVEKGERIKSGDIIARSGNSGISTGPHLHYELRKDGKPVDPSALTALP